MDRVVRILVASSAIAAILGVGAVARAQTAAGTVTGVTPPATLFRGTNQMSVSSNMPVQVADRIEVGAGGHVTVLLSDQSTLEIGESTAMVFDQQTLNPAGGRSSTSIRLLRGAMRSLVKVATTSAPDFVVHTPNAVTAVRGTRFDTSYTEGATRPDYGTCTRFTDVIVFEGTVGARNAANTSGAETSVPAGYETTIACDSDPSSPGPIGMTGIPSDTSNPMTAGVQGVAPPPAAGGEPAVPSFGQPGGGKP